MKKCPSCGSEIDKKNKSCPYCRCETTLETKNQNEDLLDKDNSIIFKYKDFINDEQLYQSALLKLNGLGVEKDEEEAFELFRTLAYRGHLESMYMFANMLLEQKNPDKESALKWLHFAAENGHQMSKIKIKMFDNKVELVNNKVYVPNDSEGLTSLVHNSLPYIVSINAKENKGNKIICHNGSGYIVSGGYVITNAHVICSDRKNATNLLDFINSIEAHYEPSISSISYILKPIAIYPTLDIAVLTFVGEKDKDVKMQDNLSFRIDNLAYGEKVYTIGNPLNVGLSVSQGIISCPNRNYGNIEYIQADIAINHGNSGGALLDFNNNVIGMVTSTPPKREDGMALCIPAKKIVEVLNDLYKKNKE